MRKRARGAPFLTQEDIPALRAGRPYRFPGAFSLPAGTEIQVFGFEEPVRSDCVVDPFDGPDGSGYSALQPYLEEIDATDSADLPSEPAEDHFPAHSSIAFL